ncbi:MAG: hypothetical protein AB8B47_04230 [Roseobacter sp.]
MQNSFLGIQGATPEQEDRGLFKTYGGPMEVEMVPHVTRPKKFLFLAKAYFETNTEILAVFSGRRATETTPLRRLLNAMENNARQHAVARRAPPPNLDLIRLPVQIKGSWQYEFYRNDDGEEIKVVQLIVARWAFSDATGKLHQFGEAPAYDLQTRQRNKSYILQTRDVDAIPRDSRLGAQKE